MEKKKQEAKQQHPKLQQNKSRGDTSPLKSFARYSGMGFQMVIIILIFYWAGSKLDERASTEKPVFTAILTLFGVFAGLYLTLKDFIFRKDD